MSFTSNLDWPTLEHSKQVRGKRHVFSTLSHLPRHPTNKLSSYLCCASTGSRIIYMGLRMNDIHAPTVASGPSSTQANGAEREKLSLPELIAEKDRVWSELSALGSVLDSVSAAFP